MIGFASLDGSLASDGVPLGEIARQTGTPVHVYSGGLIDARYGALDQAFAARPHRLHYAIKANATLAIVERLRRLGASADANSGGEIDVALRAGFAPGEIVFTGVGKTAAELERAVALGVGAINVESPGEAERIDAIAGAAGRRARIAVRINPDVDAGSHPHISTGSRINKFGMSIDAARAMIRQMTRRSSLAVVGLHVHIGSQLTQIDPLARAARAAAALAAELEREGIVLEHLDVGGGLGIAYRAGQPVLSIAEYARAILEATPSHLPLLLEPGRWIVGPAGVLVATVVDLKPQPDGGSFVVLDAGMTDLLRPALYSAWHEIEAVAPRSGAGIACDVVGPVCETADTFAVGRELPPVEVGDLVAIRDTGAYGSAMASNYNRRPFAAEALTENGAWRLVRRRQSLDELMQWDV